jgi:hypothetical protein
VRWPTITLVAALGVLASCTDRATAKDQAGAGSTEGTATAPDDDGSPDDGAPDDGGSSTGGPDGGGTSTETDDGGTTGDGDGETGDGGTGDGDTSEGDGGVFIGAPDEGAVGDCDPGLQDCPDPNEKCTAYVTEPGYCCVDANKCVPIIGNKTFGDICERTADNDDCDKGFFCMTSTSGSTGQGFCLEFCVPGDDTTCEHGGTCQSFNDGVLPICEEECDPVLQNCPNDMVCVWAFDIFICAYSGEPGTGDYGDDCYTVQSCLPGLVCVSADAYGPDCTGGDACCTAFCDINDGGAGNPRCINPAHECVPWFEAGQAPQGYEHVGACMIPQ